MASHHLVFVLSPCSRCFYNGIIEDRKRLMIQYRSPGGGACLTRTGAVGLPKGLLPEPGAGLSRRDIAFRSTLKAMETQGVENGYIGGLVEIPLTCYKFLGLSEKAEKDEVVKAVMDLKGSEVEAGYTGDAIISRQHLLMDIRDKLLFEPEYEGNLKEHVSPKSSVRIPWAWFPGALCLLQEVGEEKMVLDIGRAALQHYDVKPYVHDVLLSMALAECAIAKASFEKSKVSEGFEALARAQYLLKSNVSLGSMPLLSQIEDSLEELAPACTLELLSLPYSSDNAERRRGAIAALRELLRQGLDVVTSCRVQDWNCFLSQALNMLMAAEIIDLLSWEKLAIARKNKKLFESQNQRVVIDFDCFYLAMIAHLALGFSTRQMDLINRAKIICGCLIASEGVELKLEEALFSFLLGQGSEAAAFEKLQQLEISGNSSLQNTAVDSPKTEFRDKQAVYQSLETWLKDAVLSVFPDTRECTPSLSNFFGGPKRILSCSNKKTLTSTTSYASNRSSSSRDHITFVEHSPMKSARVIGAAVKQLAPASLQTQSSMKNVADMTIIPSGSLRRNLDMQSSKFWENWRINGDSVGRIAWATFIGCVVLGVIKLLGTEFGHPRFSHMLLGSQSRMNSSAPIWTFGNTPGVKSYSTLDKNFFSWLKNINAVFKHNCRYPLGRRKIENPSLIDNPSSLNMASTIAGTAVYREQMPLEKAESLVKQWQGVKAEALGPDHQIHTLSEILSESMLSKWHNLACAARDKANYWRFVLLKLSILRADILLDELGVEMAEVEAAMEEAAELVNESLPRNPSYYSTYKVRYLLKKLQDGSWRFCGSTINDTT